MSSEGVQQRDTGIDLCRIFACFSLLPFHYCTYGQLGASEAYLYSGEIVKTLFGFHVPLFLMISGALFMGRDQIDIKRLYTRNILKLVYVYIFWSVIYSIFDVILNYQNITDIKNLVIWIVMDIRDSHYHLWYLPMIIGIYILIPIMHSAFGGGKNREVLKYAVTVFAVFGVVIYTLLLIPVGVDTYEIMLKKIDVGTFAGWMGFFLTGYYLYSVRFDLKTKTMRNCIIASAISIVVTVIANLGKVDTEGINSYLSYFSLPCVIVECTLFLLFVRGNYDSLRRKEFIGRLADCMLGVYCMHDLVMSLVHMIFSFIPDGLFIIRLIIVTVISFILCTAIVMGLRKSIIMKRIAV